MTKRALSLLLTLVMVLSLCVPALAAEEFEAEAPAEVVEEAPVAPEAPVEPEAEEPAEEPVVDEPAVEEPVEEPVVDAPEMASIMEEEMADEPYLVAIGVVSKLNHYYLEKALEKAEPYKARVDAGELYVNGDPDAKGDDDGSDDGDAATEFNEAYALAERYDSAIHALTEAGSDVNDVSVENATDDLLAMFPSDGSDTWSKAANYDANDPTAGEYLTDKVPNNAVPFTTDDETLNNLVYPVNHYSDEDVENIYKDSDYQSDPEYGDAAPLDTTNQYFSAKDTTPWAKMYAATYVDALKAAMTAAKSFVKLGSAAKYEDYKGVMDAIKAAEALEQEAGRPVRANASTLDTLLAQYEAVAEKDYGKYVAYNPDLNDNNLISNLRNDTLGLNGFAGGVTLYDYNQAISDLQKSLVKKDTTVKALDQQISANKETITVIIGIPDDAGALNDGRTYGYSYKVDKLYAKADNGVMDATGVASKEECYAKLTEEPWTNYRDSVYSLEPTDFGSGTIDTAKTKGYKTIELTLKPIGTEDDTAPADPTAPFTFKEKITVYIYEALNVNEKGEITWRKSPSATWNVTFPGDGYIGPVIGTDSGDVKVTPADFTTKLEYKGLGTMPTKYVGTDEVTIAVKTDVDMGDYDTDYINYAIELLDRSNKVIGATDKDGSNKWENSSDDAIVIDKSTKTGTYNVALDASKIVAGSMNLRLRVATNPKSGLTTHSTATVTFDSITKWEGISQVKKLLADVAKLVKTDYQLDEDDPYLVEHPEVDTLNEAWQLLQDDAKLLQAYVDGGTYANTNYNREKISDLVHDEVIVFGYLEAIKPDVEDLQDLLTEAEEIKEDDYTYYSFGELQEAIKKAQKAMGSDLQSTVDKAYLALRAALNGLELEGEIDKSELIAAIAAADALVEEDYTPASWAANKDAIDSAKSAAQIVVDDAYATQPQVTAALATLQAAMDKLEKIFEEADKAELEAAIAAAEALNAGDYTPESWAKLAVALDAAKTLDADEYAAQNDVIAATKTLNDAIAALVEVEPAVDKSALAAAIEDAEALEEADYTAESWAPFAEALADAIAVNGDEDATQADIEAAVKALADAKAALVEAEPAEPADKSELIAGIAVITALSEYKADYTAESWAAVEAALEAAEAVLDDENATQAEVDAAVQAMIDALDALEEVPAVIPPAPSSGTGWVENDAGDIYFYQKGEVKKSFWVGKADGASKWDGNWYYVGSDGKLVTGMAYLDDLHGGYGWYFLQPTNKNGEIGKMLTGWQWVGGEYGTCYFSTKSGSSGKCTYSTELGDWNGTTWAK